jgi:pimeloyl-ACP methyl ester carboxylesterase
MHQSSNGPDSASTFAGYRPISGRRKLSARLTRLVRGSLSLGTFPVHPLGRFTGALLKHLNTPQRRAHGLVLVLPGIEGESCLNHSIARGLADGGVPLAIEICDWTTGVILLFLYHLRSRRRNMAQAERLARRITGYQAEYPGRPVYLVGHSGGGAMTVLTLEHLPPGVRVTGAVLLQAAISPGHDLTAALAATERGIWNFHSRCDIFFDGIGTLIAGTLDGCHTPAAGMVGFRQPAELRADGSEMYATRLHQVAYRPAMCGNFHFGGHMDATNRVFVAERIAPLLSEHSRCAAAQP